MNGTNSPLKPGIYIRGTETVDSILSAARAVLIDEGAGAFTIRRIAARCDMKVGNVSYHFPRKEVLVQVLLEELIDSYAQMLDDSVYKPGLTAEERLRRFIRFCLDDIRTKSTTRLFTELWALANHNEFIGDRVRAFYGRVHGVIGRYVAEINPALTPDEVHSVALYISGSLEGSTPFLGYQKPWADKMGAYTALAEKALLDLAKTVTSREIAAMPRALSW